MDTSDNEQLEQQQTSSFPDFQHLNMDLCMELICPYLELDDLSRIADSCKQMKRAAELTFAHKYRKKFISIANKEKGPIHCAPDESKINLSEPSSCFKVLRCFGYMISRLHLQCSCSTSAFWTHVDEYIAKYCADHLTELEMWNRRTKFENLDVIFPKVEKVRFIKCNLDTTITKFNERFPKMRSLEFATAYSASTVVADQRCIVDHFPNLEHLSIHLSSSKFSTTAECGFHEESALRCLELNPKVRSLNLLLEYDYFRHEFVKEISKKCQSLEALQITGYPLRFNDVVHFKNVKYFKFEHLYATLSTPIPLTFDALETFDCNMLTELSIIFEFVRKNPSISKTILSLLGKCLTHEKIIEMKDAFALVKEIEIDVFVNGNLSGEEIPFLLNSLNSLQNLTLKPSFDCKIDEFSKSVKLLPHTPWAIDKSNGTIKFHRIESIKKKVI